MSPEILWQLYPGARPRLVAALSRLVGPAQAEELVQEAFLRAHAGAEDFRDEAAPLTWLYRIALNLAHDALRRHRLTVQPEAADAAIPDAPLSPDPEALMEQAQMAQCLHRLLEALPAHYREVLVKVDMLGYRTAELSGAAGLSDGNIKIRLHRARRALKQAIEKNCELHRRDANVLYCAARSRAA